MRGGDSPDWKDLDRWDGIAVVVVIAALVAINGCADDTYSVPPLEETVDRASRFTPIPEQQ